MLFDFIAINDKGTSLLKKKFHCLFSSDILKQRRFLIMQAITKYYVDTKTCSFPFHLNKNIRYSQNRYKNVRKLFVFHGNILQLIQK